MSSTIAIPALTGEGVGIPLGACAPANWLAPAPPAAPKRLSSPACNATCPVPRSKTAWCQRFRWYANMLRPNHTSSGGLSQPCADDWPDGQTSSGGPGGEALPGLRRGRFTGDCSADLPPRCLGCRCPPFGRAVHSRKKSPNGIESNQIDPLASRPRCA